MRVPNNQVLLCASIYAYLFHVCVEGVTACISVASSILIFSCYLDRARKTVGRETKTHWHENSNTFYAQLYSSKFFELWFSILIWSIVSIILVILIDQFNLPLTKNKTTHQNTHSFITVIHTHLSLCLIYIHIWEVKNYLITSISFWKLNKDGNTDILKISYILHNLLDISGIIILADLFLKSKTLTVILHENNEKEETIYLYALSATFLFLWISSYKFTLYQRYQNILYIILSMEYNSWAKTELEHIRIFQLI